MEPGTFLHSHSALTQSLTQVLSSCWAGETDLEKLRNLPHITQPAAAAKLFQSCPTLCDPIDSSPPGSPVPGILQARTLEWAAISFSKQALTGTILCKKKKKKNVMDNLV